MWTRSELKTQSKAAFKRNYWKAVLVALIIAGLGGGAAAGAGAGVPAGLSSGLKDNSQEVQTYDSTQDIIDEYADGDFGEYDEDGQTPPDIQGAFDDLQKDENADVRRALAAMAGIIIFIVLVALAIGIVVSVFLYLPLEVGCSRFFFRNLKEKAEIKEVAHGYDHNYMNNVKTLFFRDLFVFLWSLLFIIPGIVKSYQYRMIPYLLAEYPELTKDEAFARSKYLMNGNKWKAFVLDLSFVGWWILSGLTLGILGIFYVNPYYYNTCAALYNRLEHGNTEGLEVPVVQPAAGTDLFTGGAQ